MICIIGVTAHNAYTRRMTPYTHAFLKAGLWYLLAGIFVALLVVFAADPTQAAVVWMPTHAHLLVVGWIGMTTFGVAYHVVPRFCGRTLFAPRATWVHWLACNIGLIGITSGFVLSRSGHAIGTLVLRGGALCFAIGVGIFVWNIWKTLPPLCEHLQKFSGGCACHGKSSGAMPTC